MLKTINDDENKKLNFYNVASKKHATMATNHNQKYGKLSRLELQDLLRQRTYGFTGQKRARNYNFNGDRAGLIDILNDIDRNPYKKSNTEYFELQQALKGNKDFTGPRTKERMRAFIQEEAKRPINPYKNLTRPQLQDELKNRLRGINKEQKKALGINLTVSNQRLKQLLTNLDINPIRRAPTEYELLYGQYKSNPNFKGRRTLENLRTFKQYNEDIQGLKEPQEINQNYINKFNQTLSQFKNNKYGINPDDLEAMFNNISNSPNYYVMNFTMENGNINQVPLRDVNIENIIKSINDRANFNINTTSFGTKDEWAELDYENIVKMEITPVKYFKKDLDGVRSAIDKKNRKQSGFFKKSIKAEYYNEFDLTKYQIYNIDKEAYYKDELKTEEGQKKYNMTQIYFTMDPQRAISEMMNKTESECCLIHTLRRAGIETELINAVMVNLSLGRKEVNIPLSKLQEIAKMIKRKIVIKTVGLTDNAKRRELTYNKEEKETLYIAQYDNHYFLYEPETQYTEFFLKYHKQLKEYFESGQAKKYNWADDRLKFNKFSNGMFKIDKSRKYSYLDSLELVIKLDQYDFLEEYSHALHCANVYLATPSLHNIKEEQQTPKEKKESKVNPKGELFNLPSEVREGKTPVPVFIYADTETQINDEEGNDIYHKPISFHFRIENDREEYPVIMNTVGCSKYDIGRKIQNALHTAIRRNQTRNGFNFEELDSKGLFEINKLKNVKMMFHNLKYDKTVLSRYFTTTEELTKDGNLYSWTFKIYGPEFKPTLNKDKPIFITAVDSFKHLSTGLSKIPKMLNIEGLAKKEAIAYKYHRKANMYITSVEKVETYKQLLKPKDQNHFIEILEESLSNGNPYEFNAIQGTFNPTLYYNDYLKQDTNVLMEVVQKYRVLMNKITGLDTNNILTISSLGHSYAKNEGVYDGLYEVKGGLREYIQKSIRGGRVFVNPKYRKQAITDIVSDLDKVSLYPSSMKRLAEEYGLPMGEIYRGGALKFEEYQSPAVSWYVVTIKITKINKAQQVPLLTIKDEEGLLKYINNLPINDKGEEQHIIMEVDKITLEDLLRLHKIEFEITDGVYWKTENGVNKKMANFILSLHVLRCQYKKSNPAMATLIKLIMNSIYGKTITKRGDTKTIYKQPYEADNYLFNNFGLIKTVEKQFSDEDKHITTRFELRDYDKSSVFNYVGGAILAMSKRIMGEVFEIMDENNYPVYYTDTDSIHMNKADVKPLEDLFIKRYGRKLIGTDLGQLHEDFNLEYDQLDEKGNEILDEYLTVKTLKCDDVLSIYHVPIEPKVYLDVLKGNNKEGNLTFELHIRIKGITKGGIKHKIDEYKTKISTLQNPYKYFKRILKHHKITTPISSIERLDEIEAVIRLFNDIRHNKEITFNMNPNGADKPTFEFTNSGVKEHRNFYRTLNKKKERTDSGDVIIWTGTREELYNTTSTTSITPQEP